MPIFDIDPGTLPETNGTLSFYRQGDDPSQGMQLTSQGVMTLATSLTVPTVTQSGVGQLRQVAKAALLNRASTVTPTDDPDLTLSVVANAVYEVRALLVWTNGGGGFRMTWNVPAAASMTWTDGGGSGAVAPTTNGTFVSSTGTESVGRLVTGANAGACTLQWAQNTSNAANTALQAGSFLSLRRTG
jgi:hypothetical protein